MRRVGFYLVAAVLFLTGVMGIREAVSDWVEASTLAQFVCTAFIAAFGCLGLGAGVAVLARRPWAKGLILGWAATLLASGILAPVVWVWPGIVPILAGVVVILILTGLTYRGWQTTASSKSD